MPNDRPDTSEQPQETPLPDRAPTSRLYADAYSQVSMAGRDAAPIRPPGENRNAVDGQNNPPREVPKDQHEQKNADGSAVVLGKTGDGKEHPIGIKYTDGSATEYSYGADGKVNGFKNYNPDGSVKESFKSADGKHFVDEVNPGKTMDGTATVNRDGTAKFTDAAGNSIEARTDGRAIWQVKDAQGQEHKFLLNRDGSSVEFKKTGDGKEHPTSIHFPDGRETTYEYNKDGKISAVTDWGVGGEAGGVRIMKYASENGKDWKDPYGRGPDIHGPISFTDTGLHTFEDATTGNTWVRSTDGKIAVKDKGGNPVTPDKLFPQPRAKK